MHHYFKRMFEVERLEPFHANVIEILSPSKVDEEQRRRRHVLKLSKKNKKKTGEQLCV